MTISYVPAAITLTASNQTVYTVPDGVSTAVIISGVCNNITTDTTLTAWVVASGDSAANTNQFITTLTVSTTAPDPLDPLTGMVLETGDSIVMVAADANRLNVRLGIMEIVDG